MAEKPKKEAIKVVLEPLKLKRVKLTVVGTTPLLMDKFPEEVQKAIEDKQKGIKSGKKQVRDTGKEVKEAIHKTSKGKIGFPAHGFKAGMCECTSFVGDKFFSKKLVSGAVSIVNVEDGLIPIKFSKQTVLKHNIGHNTKYSPCFEGWSADLEIVYDENNISPQDIATLLDYAGHYQGVGAWRPKCAAGGTGSYGQYKVKLTKM